MSFMSYRKDDKMSRDCTWFCSIDIGTSFSGYAFAPRKNITQNPCEIYSPVWIKDSSSRKTPTSVLLDPDRNFSAFGYAADEKYEKLLDKEEHENWFYFRDFKMKLYDAEQVTRETSIQDIHGKPFTAQQIFKISIRFLREHFLNLLKMRNYKIPESDICYTVTVPAIWSDAAKQFMKEAAIQAGICGARLVIAYEPEAAALFCKQLPTDRMAANDEPIQFVADQPYIVVDLGGGTADITVQKISSTGNVHNLHKASGGPWGGNQINKVFMELLVKLFGESTFGDFCKENMDDFFNISQKIEVNKRLISTVKDETVKIDIPTTLVEKLAEMYQLSGLESLKKAIKDANLQNMIEAKKGNKLFIKNAYFLDFFRTVCGKTVHLVKSIIQNDQQCNNIKYIILVGGFSESEVVQKNFRENFPDHEIKIPFEGGLAVLKGGTIYGFDSSIIQTRICPYTYGIKLERKFNPNIDNLSKTFMKGDQLYSEDCFDKFFEIDEPLTVGTKRSIEVHLNHDDDSLSCDLTDYKEIEVFSSLEKSPLYTTDLTCRLHGMIRVYPPRGRWPIMVRGRVEIEVTGADNFRITYIDNTGFTTSGTIDFLSS